MKSITDILGKCVLPYVTNAQFIKLSSLKNVLINSYKEKPAIYIGFIGLYDNRLVFAVDYTNDLYYSIVQRDMLEYPNFTLVHITACDDPGIMTSLMEWLQREKLYRDICFNENTFSVDM